MTDNEILKTISARIRTYVTDPSVSNDYGKWGALRFDQRREIRKLCDACDMFEKMANEYRKEIEELQNLINEMSDYFPCCNDCEGKNALGERTDKCVYLIDNTNYCAKRGVENIGRILKENEKQKAEIEEKKKKLQEILPIVAKLKTEAIKEFAERLKDIYTTHEGLHKEIDNLVKEMTEGTK